MGAVEQRSFVEENSSKIINLKEYGEKHINYDIVIFGQKKKHGYNKITHMN